MKPILLVGFLLTGLLVRAQEYRHIANTPFQIQLPADYLFDGSKYTKDPEMFGSDEYCFILSEAGYLEDSTLLLVDTIEFKNDAEYKDYDKIIHFDKIELNGHNGSRIQVMNKYGYKTFLFVIHDKVKYQILAKTSLNFKADMAAQLKILNSAKFIPETLPDGLKDFKFNYDATLLQNMEINNEYGYPNIQYKITNNYKTCLILSQVFENTQTQKQPNIIKYQTESRLNEPVLISSTDVSIAGMKGKEIIYHGKNYDDELTLNYRLILFDSANKFYLLVKYEIAENLDKNLVMIQDFVKTIEPKK